MMRSADALATVRVVAADQSSDGVPRGAGPALSGPRWLAPAVLAGGAGLMTLSLATGPYPHDRVQRLFLAIVACLPIVGLRRWPLRVLAVVAMASGVFTAASGIASLPFAIMTGLAAYFVASRLPRHVSVPAVVAAAVVLGVALLYAVLAVRTAAP